MWMIELTTKTIIDDSNIGSHSACSPTMDCSPWALPAQFCEGRGASSNSGGAGEGLTRTSSIAVGSVECGAPERRSGRAMQQQPALVQIDRMALQVIQRHHRQRFLVRGGEHDRGRNARVQRLAPAPRTQAPAIAGLQARET